MNDINLKKEDALVLVSGGQDSITTLFWSIKTFNKVYGISFFYGQKHNEEIDVARNICGELGVSHKTVDISFIKDVVISNLFLGTGDVNEKHKLDSSVPSSFVPYRNLLFLTIAAGWASTIGVRNIVIGVCETDYSGYADCRDIFIKSCQNTLNLATDFEDNKVIIHTPLMKMSKADEFMMAKELGCLDFILKKTLTCYNGVKKANDFGMGCGECPSCLLRKKGYEEFLDKLNAVNLKGN